jgi:hypothetical protein
MGTNAFERHEICKKAYEIRKVRYQRVWEQIGNKLGTKWEQMKNFSYIEIYLSFILVFLLICCAMAGIVAAPGRTLCGGAGRLSPSATRLGWDEWRNWVWRSSRQSAADRRSADTELGRECKPGRAAVSWAM